LTGSVPLSQNGCNWIHTDLHLPDLFSIEKTENGHEGTVVIDVFHEYNFFPRDDEPLEKELAVGPDMISVKNC
jgi:hypothetical protein